MNSENDIELPLKYSIHGNNATILDANNLALLVIEVTAKESENEALEVRRAAERKIRELTHAIESTRG